MLQHNRYQRRDILRRAGSGAGMLGLATLLQSEGILQPAGAADISNPLAPKDGHFDGRVKRVIWLFINGGPSHVDTWDYKPELEKSDGKELEGFDRFTGFFANSVGPLMKSPFKFQQHGECGKWVSEIFPNLSQHVDKMAFIHSGHTESNNHSPALFMMNTGLPRMGNPCVGSWVTYGLGSESQNLPAFVVMSDPKGRGLPKGYSLNWGAGFLPSVYQGTWLKPQGDPIDNLKPPAELNESRQRAQLNLLASLNRQHLEQRPAERDLAARMESFELAYRMQVAAPETLDVALEPEHIQQQYGIGDEKCDHFAKQCLIARRMVERGVRFVQIYSGGMENQRSWDGHNDIAGNHTGFAGETDKPIAGLLADLDQRGLLNDTLVVWGGEFGRLPVAQKSAKPGRDHNPHAFTYWMAGGGIKGGTSYGATDEIGHKAVDDRVSVNDLHATILHLLGVNHEQLTYRHNGRDYRLTDVAGNVIDRILA
ncbi:MAG: DUF1501 domain-containing protein [Fuerstiella sp.]|jgi:hypothetical protein|nr:DUF1501 domain-containing protein [Fuerstiella sp.]MCP4506190.1 DUF1501 domain-containing protein [Fuerstiella sp.]MDG2127958.1 DUF1501 domain-containing protein [Fuerstiella sp.]